MILSLKEIRFDYGGGKSSSPLFDHLDLTVREGGVTALIGRNGSGKTTLFNIISGFEPHCSGDVYYKDVRLNTLPPSRRAQLGIGRLFQGARLSSDLTLLDNMLLAYNPSAKMANPFASVFGRRQISQIEKKGRQDVVTLLNSFFGTGNKYVEKLDEPAEALSFGEQRLIALVRLMLGNYDLLLLDEPTSGVNPVHVTRIEEIIHRMQDEGKTILLIEHNIGFVRQTADSCAYLEDGRIVKEDDIATVLSDEHIKNSYLGV